MPLKLSRRPHPCRTLFLLFLSLLFTITPLAGAQNHFFPEVQGLIKQQILSQSGRDTFVCRTELVCGIALVPAFYSTRDYQPVWIQQPNDLSTANQLLNEIRKATAEGLNSAAYHLVTIEEILSSIRFGEQFNTLAQAALLADLDILLTDAFLLYGSHLSSGRVNPETLHTDWIVKSHQADLMHSIESALKESRIPQTLMALKPPHADYTGLRDKLKSYRDLADKGGWPVIPQGPTLRAGTRSNRVPIIRHRLRITGDLKGDGNSHASDLFDEALVEAVKRFQQRHGLKVDGQVGKRTRHEMNIPAELRARQIELNMERWRWIPHQLGKRYIYVNIDDFNLSLIDNQKPILKMRAVVGKPFRKTPVFSANMRYLDVNPYWNIPTNIVLRDILPNIRRDTDYLEKMKIRVFADWSEDASELDPNQIDWQVVGSNYFPYKLRQDPGPENALGRIKFMFPNKFAVYIHDTPHRGLFRSDHQRVQFRVHPGSKTDPAGPPFARKPAAMDTATFGPEVGKRPTDHHPFKPAGACSFALPDGLDRREWHHAIPTRPL